MPGNWLTPTMSEPTDPNAEVEVEVTVETTVETEVVDVDGDGVVDGGEMTRSSSSTGAAGRSSP